MSNLSTGLQQTMDSSIGGAHGITTMSEYVEWLEGMAEAGVEFSDLSQTMMSITLNKGHNVMMWDLGYKI